MYEPDAIKGKAPNQEQESKLNYINRMAVLLPSHAVIKRPGHAVHVLNVLNFSTKERGVCGI